MANVCVEVEIYLLNVTVLMSIFVLTSLTKFLKHFLVYTMFNMLLTLCNSVVGPRQD